MLDLYARTWQGEQLGDDEYVISADEKTSLQARCRCHPTLAPGKARAMRVNHTYGRGGALAYLAAYDVHAAKVFGRTEERTGIVPFMNLATQVMSQEPYASAKRVFWIVDNGSSHRGQKAADRLTAAFANTVMVHTPVHASWLNQVETYFSAVQRKALSPNDFTDLTEVRGPAPSLRRPLQRHGTAVPVEVHHLRPGRSAGQARPAHRRSPRRILCRTGSVNNPRRIYDADHLARRPYRRSDAAMLRADLSALEGASVNAADERSRSTARLWKTYAACVLAGAIVGAGAVGSLWWASDGGNSRPSGPPFEAIGTVTVFGSWVGGQADEGCVGIDDFADLRPGAPIKVFDLSGNQFAQGRLKAGIAGKVVGNSCAWPIEVNWDT
ncbi:transposase [Streptomyces inhibens]|uniref:transposase n=1 Tax=Streptomyces inhibens TaxID=2293571 RepID=UPI00368C4F68